MLEVGKKLGGETHVFWGGREGFATALNTKVKTELDHMASFLKMAVDYKKKIGFEAQFAIEPKAREPTAHQYDYDAQTVIGFLYQHGLEKDFKVNIEPNHTTLAGHDYVPAPKNNRESSRVRLNWSRDPTHPEPLSGARPAHGLGLGHAGLRGLRRARSKAKALFFCSSALLSLPHADPRVRSLSRGNAGQPYLGWDTDEFPSDPRPQGWT